MIKKKAKIFQFGVLKLDNRNFHFGKIHIF